MTYKVKENNLIYIKLRESCLLRHVRLQRGAYSLHSSTRTLHTERHLRTMGLDWVASRLFRLLPRRFLLLFPKTKGGLNIVPSYATNKNTYIIGD